MAKSQILVVEDEIIIAMDIQDDLENLGYKVVGVVPSGEEAIDCARDLAPDIVLMDIVLEGDMDGITAAEKIRSSFNIPVVYLTAYSDNIILERAKLTEPFGYILKPFDERELQTNIEMALYKHKIEKRLKENEQWLSTTLRSIGDAVIATDEKGLVTFVNPVAESLTGWRQEEALGRDLTEIFSITNNGKPGENPALKALDQGSAVYLKDDTMLISKDGSTRPVDDSAAPIKDEMGNVTGAVLIFHDITDRKKSEEALKDARDKLKALIDALPLAIFSSDSDLNILSWNDAAERIFGWSEREVLGKANPCLRERDESHASAWAKEIIKGQAFRDIKQKRKDGSTVDISLSVAPLLNSDSETVGIIFIADDVTDKRKMEELNDSYIELKNAYTELKEKEKATFEFTSMISQELFDPISVISSHVDMLEEGALGDLNSPQLEKMQAIRSQVDQMTRLIKDMLETSRHEPQKIEIIRTASRIEDIAASAVKDISLVARGRSQEICLEAELNLPDVEIDGQRIKQVFNCLLTNAMQHIPEGGRISIRIKDQGSHVLISVSDNGTGIARVDLDEISKSIFAIGSDDRPAENTKLGIGLLMAKAVAQAHGGEMWAESEKGTGSTFYFTLPVRLCTEAAADTAKISSVQSRNKDNHSVNSSRKALSQKNDAT